MNKCIIIGNLTKQPELSTTSNGVSVCKFSVAVNRPFKNEGENSVDFFNVTAWRGLADNCGKWLDKGRKVCVVGSIQFRTYTDNNGNTRYTSDLVAESVEFLSSSANTEEKTETDSVNESLPF
jgi:single-strand DNA-binding protein